jgi:hypothetical protein
MTYTRHRDLVRVPGLPLIGNIDVFKQSDVVFTKITELVSIIFSVLVALFSTDNTVDVVLL